MELDATDVWIGLLEDGMSLSKNGKTEGESIVGS